ncbi:MAG: sigma-70 family RNA polymerase sigma factor [Syntrophaceae bacterium]|nr:sigma-70 family RNA polymerase sigma factor [Syntrophaceae bacterium]
MLNARDALPNGGDITLSVQEIVQIEGYLFRNARNRCYNTLRDFRYSKDVYEMEESLPDLSDNHSEIRERLRDAVQELPDELREPLVLCDYQGYSYEEISVITDVPVSTLRKRLFRARNKLRTMLNPGKNRQ